MNDRSGISLIVLIITIIIIVILAGTVILSLSDSNPILQATKASFLNDVKILQTELELSLSKEYLDSLGSYDITLLQANETSITYKGVEDKTKNIYDLIPSLKSNTQYSGQVEIIDGKLTYKGTDTNKQEWAKEVGIVLPLDIDGGNVYSVALMYDGTVKSWGRNASGQLGDGTKNNSYVPVSVSGLTNVKEIVAGSYHTFALLNDGTVKAWGGNATGSLGDGTTTDSTVPILINLTDVKQIVAGSGFSMALLNNGTVKSWGYNNVGQLGDGTTTTNIVPTLIEGLTEVKQIGIGSNFSVALLNNGTVKTWGSNTYGQLGDGTLVNSSIPKLVPNLDNVEQIIVGINHMLVILEDGSVKAWGKNTEKQLGDGTAVNKTTPTLIVGLTDIKQMYAGSYHTVALLNDGKLKVWGTNWQGQLGDGTTTSKATPTLSTIADIKKIAVGDFHTIAILNNGTVKTWGSNSFGQIGDGTTVNRLLPTLININDKDKTAPNVAFVKNGGSLYSTSALVTDIDGSVSTLQYAWSTQNTVVPTSEWKDFVSEGTIQRENIGQIEYLWIKAIDSALNTTIVKSNAFTALSQVTVNKPLLATGMTAKKWNGSSWDTVSNPDTDTSWYDYTSNKWANVQTLDGSMWVWIPRYEYKIPTPHSNIAQTIDVNFLTDTQTTPTNGYIVHPGFTFGNIELTGIWVAKFEASGTVAAVNIKPGVPSLRSITISTMFTACRNMETNNRYGWGVSGTGIDTHLMKNVEWGAVAYLANSRYGKNSKVWINPQYDWLTGQCGRSKTEVSTNWTYNYDNLVYGVNASTTGNIYGVYDMSGGIAEYTAAYINNGNTSLTTYGSSLVNAETHYKDVYTKGANDDSATNYALSSGKFGDAIYETTSSSTGSTSWYGGFSNMPYSSSSFFIRGGTLYDYTSADIFGFNSANGNSSNYNGFRPVLAVSNEL